MGSQLAIEFIKEALETQAKVDNDVLWAKCDICIDVKNGAKIASPSRFTLTLRDNIDGPGQVSCYIVTIEEIKL